MSASDASLGSSPAIAIAIAIAISSIIVAIEVPSKAKSSLRACGLPTLLYLGIFVLGNALATLFAFYLLTDEILGPLAPLRAFPAAFAGVFAFQGILTNTNISFLQKDVLTFENWVNLARDGAIAGANKKQIGIDEVRLIKTASKLKDVDEQVLNAHIAGLKDTSVADLEAAAQKDNSDRRYYKALYLVSKLSRQKLDALIANG